MIFIALQNPGKEYAQTRHNAGAIVLTEVAKSPQLPLNKGGEMTCYFSDEYMNLSGNFVKKVLKKENALPEDLYVFFDDINVPVGKFIISKGVGASSHNGVKSVQAVLRKNDFYRVRIGVGRVGPDGQVENVHGPEMDKAVLSKLTEPEIAILKALAPKVVEKILSENKV
jgi:PTH1 family peptidyl-tRNA hydrolase